MNGVSAMSSRSTQGALRMHMPLTPIPAAIAADPAPGAQVPVADSRELSSGRKRQRDPLSDDQPVMPLSEARSAQTPAGLAANSTDPADRESDLRFAQAVNRYLGIDFLT